VFDLGAPVDPARLQWWALDVGTDQALKDRYGTELTVVGADVGRSTAWLYVEDGALPTGTANVQRQLRLSWS